jgi:hypothetical protein
VKVLGPDWKPLAGAQFSTRYESRNSSSSSGAEGIRMADGSYRVRLRQHGERGEGGKWTLEVSVAGFGEKTVELSPIEEPTVVVRFEEPAMLTVKVEGVEGSGYEGRVDVGVFGGGVRRSGTSRSYEGGGERELGPFVPGDYDLELRVRTGVHESATVATRKVRLRAGRNVETIGLTVLTEGLGDEVLLHVRSEDGTWSGSFAAKDGSVRVEGLPAGTYSIRSRGGGRGQMTVVVPAQDVVRFEARPVNALRVRIEDENGPVARAGLRTGDLIVGVDGKLFESEMDIQVKMMAAMGKESAKLMVQRGATRLEIALDMRPFMTREVEPGADLEPATR